MAVLILLLSACTWTPPLDPDAEPVWNALAGEVVVTGAPDVAPTAVLLFDAADPPPPAGTGAPVDFSTVPPDAFTGDVADGFGAGVQSAPWALTEVADGSYLVTAILDADANFQPLFSVTAGATCGDWVGAHLADLSTGALSPVSVSGGRLLDDVTVVVGSEVTTQRPAFTLSEVPVMDQTAQGMQTFTLLSTSIHSSVVNFTGPFDGTDPCGTFFLLYVADADADGVPDPHPTPELAAQGALDLWPRVYLQLVADAQGNPLPEGESWLAEAVGSPLPVLSGDLPVGVPTPATRYDVVWVPAAEHHTADGQVEVVTAPDLPAGAWSMTVVGLSGQTWTVPNELYAVDALGADPATKASQGLVLVTQ